MDKTVAANLPAPIRALFTKKQFETQESIDNKRFLLVKGTMPTYDFPVLFKAVSPNSASDTILQRNLVMWTRSMQDTLPANAPFHIAPILEDGYVDDGCHWFITPFIEGIPFANPGNEHKINVDRPAELMPSIVALMRHVEKTSAQTVAGIDARYGSVNKKDKLHLLENAIAWARNDTPNLAELLQIINSNYRYLGSGNAHGDFTEVNLIINTKREPVLIDAEISDSYGYKYYDAVEFYNRLYTRAMHPELAKVFLHEYISALPRQSVQRFLSNFLCLSALRSIGNWMEINGSDNLSNKHQRELAARQYAEAIVTYRIINHE
jgi:hypothetical protein